MNRSDTYITLLAIICCILPGRTKAQTPFTSQGQVYVLDEQGSSLMELQIAPTNNAVGFQVISADYGIELNALGLRRTDNFLYAIGKNDNGLYRLDRSGGIELVGFPELEPAEQYLAADFTNDGRYLVAIGSNGSADQSINRIDLSLPSLPVSRVEITGANIFLSDIASDPTSSDFFGYDTKERRMVRFSPTVPAFSGFVPTDTSNEIFGLYFDAFGTLRAYGSTVDGIVSGLFEMSKATGQEQRISTGPLVFISDMASSPHNVAIASIPMPLSAFPCSKVQYTYTIANRTGQSLSGVSMASDLPIGLLYSDILSNPFGGNENGSAGDALWSISEMTIPPGQRELIVELEVGDVPAGDYLCSAKMTGLPANIGGEALSDDSRTLSRFDPSRLQVVRIEEDSIFNSFLICEGTTITLTTAGYGENTVWSDGSLASEITVSSSGTYSFDASSDCQVVHVQNVVTVASCPFTVEIGMDVEPATIYKCSEVLYHYILENESGDDRQGVGIVDTLPDGFTFLEVVKNPFGGQKVELPNPQVLKFENMSLNAGKDTFTVKVFVGDVKPKLYNLRSKLINLPAQIGTFRLSDDPKTVTLDSTAFKVLGTGTDSLILTIPICIGDELELDASPYGSDYRWYDGNSDSTRLIAEVGYYDLNLFNGCDSVYVGFDVIGAPNIMIGNTNSIYLVQGDSVALMPEIINESDSLYIAWTDPLDTTLSCLNCLMPVTNSLFSTDYWITAQNEICKDSAKISLKVDNTRRIYAPNIFSPNGDLHNDYFGISSPDYAYVQKFRIYDRWGSVLHSKVDTPIEQLFDTWDGTLAGSDLPPGVYLWYAEIRFIDQSIERFSDTVTLVR